MIIFQQVFQSPHLIDEEEDATEILRDISSNSHPASSRENKHINNMSGDATDQSNCSSDGESIGSDVDNARM